MQIPDEGIWLAHAIRNKTAQLSCDGSYQLNLSIERGGEAWSIECSATKNGTIGFLASTSRVESAYRSELTGVYTGLAMVLAESILHNIKEGV